MDTPRAEVSRSAFRSPTTLAALLEAIAETGKQAVLVAGGQSLLPHLAKTGAPVQCFIDLLRVAELRRIAIEPEWIEIGAAVNFTDLLANQAVGLLPALAHAVRCVGTIPIRNRATVGGSLAWGDARAQLPLVLLVHDATVITTRREMDIAQFVHASSLAQGEVIKSVRIRYGDARRRGYAQLMDRNSAGKAIVSVAMVRSGGDTKTFAVGGLTTRPVRSPPQVEASEWLESLGASTDVLVDPFHSYEYRSEMAAVLMRRLQLELAN